MMAIETMLKEGILVMMTMMMIMMMIMMMMMMMMMMMTKRMRMRVNMMRRSISILFMHKLNLLARVTYKYIPVFGGCSDFLLEVEDLCKEQNQCEESRHARGDNIHNTCYCCLGNQMDVM